jgi:hypothetical protein
MARWWGGAQGLSLVCGSREEGSLDGESFTVDNRDKGSGCVTNKATLANQRDPTD